MPPLNVGPIETLSEVSGAEAAEPTSVAEAGHLAWPRRILVAIHGSSSAQPAIMAARDLARRSGAVVDALTVYAPDVPAPACASRHGLDQCEASERNEAARLVRAARRLCRGSADGRLGWPLRVEVGDPGQMIVRLAAEWTPDLVVLGIGRRDPADRREGSRTPTFAARHLGASLYAVAPGCETPARCVVAFHDGQVDAPTIRAALACLRPGGRMWIVMPDCPPAPGNARSAREIVAPAAGDMAARLDDIQLERVNVGGDLLGAVMQLAEDVGAHLIAVPLLGPPGAVRAFLPNLADRLLLRARCSVLLVPAAPKAVAMRRSE